MNSIPSVNIANNNINFGNKAKLKKIAEDYALRETKGIDKKENNYITAHLFTSEIKNAFLESINVLKDSAKELFYALKFKPNNRINSMSSNRYIKNK